MNIKKAGQRKRHEALKNNIAEIPTGGIRDPIKANVAFERPLNGRCFCPPGKHYPNCKGGGRNTLQFLNQNVQLPSGGTLPKMLD